MAATIQQIFKETNFLNEQHLTMAGLLHAGALVERHITRSLEQYNLPLNKYRVLRGLRRVYPQGVGVYKLRDFLVGEKSDISRLVERMVQQGFVVRNVDPGNKSVSQIIITERGAQIVNDVENHMHEIIAPVMCLSEKEARLLNELLEKLFAALPEL